MTRRAIAVGLGALVISTSAVVFALTDEASATNRRSLSRQLTASRTGPQRTLTEGEGGNGCTVTSPHIGPGGQHATFDVHGHCTVSLVSYQRNGNGSLANQTLFDSTTEEFSCATTTSSSASASGSPSLRASGSATCAGELTVTVPDCRWQVDFVLGQPRNPPTGYPAGTVLTWRFGGEGECQPTSPTTTTTSTATSTTVESSTTTTSPPTASTPTTTLAVSPASSARPPVSVPVTPTELAQSGGGELAGIALGALLIVGAGQFSVWRGRKRRHG